MLNNVNKNKVIRITKLGVLDIVSPIIIFVVLMAIFGVFFNLLTSKETTLPSAQDYIIQNGHLFAPLFTIGTAIFMVGLLSILSYDVLTFAIKRYKPIKYEDLAVDVIYLAIAYYVSIFSIIVLWNQSIFLDVVAIIGFILIIASPATRLYVHITNRAYAGDN